MRTLPNERLSEDHRAAGPERKCILSGEIASRERLIRLAISPDGDVLPDVLARAPGRGAWIAVCRQDLENAQANGKLGGALARAFGKSATGKALTIPEDLGERIEAALLRAFTDRLGLEMRSGKLLTGSDRIAEHARAGKARFLAHAADASPDGAKKLDQAMRVGLDQEGSGRTGMRLPLDRAALSVALGRDNVVHLALTDAAATQRVADQLRRLLQFQGQAAATGNNTSFRAANEAAPSVMTTNCD